MHFRLLIVEDQAAIIEVLKEAIESAFPDVEFYDCGFEGSTLRLKSLRPDIVILDLFEDTVDIDAGGPAWDHIWNTHFCPVIIYSAHEASGYEPTLHPFRAYERKASGSERKVVEHIRGFLVHVAGLRPLREEIDGRIAESLKEVSPLVWRDAADVDLRSDLLRRVTRRRLAASLDSPAHDADMVKALEQFICPPLERSLLTGDVVREIARDDNTAQTFRVIVTPSCDLVTGDNRNPVSDVLVARCIPVNDAEVIRKCGLLNAKPTTLPEKLGKRLKKDELSNMCVLPAFYDFWPAMVVDLRKLDLIPRSEIALKKDECGISTRFYRVASLDSPFRERLSWRYVETAGRPGIPDLDQEGLEQDVVNAARPQIGG